MASSWGPDRPGGASPAFGRVDRYEPGLHPTAALCGGENRLSRRGKPLDVQGIPRAAGWSDPCRNMLAGTTPISSPRGLLLQHVSWAAGECRKVASMRHEIATDWSDPAVTALPPTWDSYGNDGGYAGLISILSQECDAALADVQFDAALSLDVLDAARYVTSRLPALGEIFQRYAPPSVCVAVAGWDEDSRACVLLGIFPARLPHRAVTSYRQATAGDSRRQITVRRRSGRSHGSAPACGRYGQPS